MKPIIGIIEWPYLDKDGDFIYEILNDMVNKVSQNKAIPIGIFPTQTEDYQNKKMLDIRNLTNIEKEDLIQALNMCDAIIKPGALRIYGYERFIYDYAVEKNIPFLGICAGMQLMNNLGNEKINTNVKNEKSEIIHQSKEKYIHELTILKNTLLYDILKKQEILVNSKHNYHINEVNNKFIINALSKDNIIEAINNKNQNFHLGLQWHPELLEDENSQLIFDRLIEEAKIYNKRK